MAAASATGIRLGVLHRHLAGVEGVRHVPTQGPFVLVANHNSFADHLVLFAVLDALRDTRSLFLTKSEAFIHPLRSQWTEAMGGVPVDRDQPGRELLATVDKIFAAGSALVVYPEGTRGPGWPLLPFKDGAFRFAVRAGVPVIPVAMWGNQHILPKGATLPRRAKARVVFGAPLAIDTSLPRPRQVAAVTEQAREVLGALVDQARNPTADRDRQAAQDLAERSEAVLETMLSHTDPQPAARRMKQARALLKMSGLSDPANADARITRIRLAGLKALEAPVPLRPALLRNVRRHTEAVLDTNPDHLMGHYILGRWHLEFPRALGGRPEQGLRHLRQAARIGAGDTRYPMAYAEALMATDRGPEAAPLLRSIINAPAPDARTADRQRRAAAHYNVLAAAGGQSSTSRE